MEQSKKTNLSSTTNYKNMRPGNPELYERSITTHNLASFSGTHCSQLSETGY